MQAQKLKRVVMLSHLFEKKILRNNHQTYIAWKDNHQGSYWQEAKDKKVMDF